MFEESAISDGFVPSNSSASMADQPGIPEQTDRLFVCASQGVHTYSGKLEQALVRLDSDQLQALSSIYNLHVFLLCHPLEKQRLYQDQGINGSRRVRYLAQPLIKHLVGEAFENAYVRNRVTVWAAVIEAAVAASIVPDRFVAFVREHGGVEAIYRSHTQPRTSKDTERALLEKLVQAKLAYAEHFPPVRLDQSEFTRGLSQGEHILIVQCDRDGNISIVARVDSDTNHAGQMYDRQVLAWAESNQVHAND